MSILRGKDTHPSEFLRYILPDIGFKVACIKPPQRGVSQVFCQSVDELWSVLEKADRQGCDTYHGCASFADPGPLSWIDNPKKPGKRIRSWDFEKRLQSRAVGARAFWLDIDAGPGKPYLTKLDAGRALTTFIQQAKLPTPCLVDSGNGLHVYWPLERVLTPPEWQPRAEALKAACIAHALHADPVRTADIASILRTPGTHNHK